MKQSSRGQRRLLKYSIILKTIGILDDNDYNKIMKSFQNKYDNG